MSDDPFNWPPLESDPAIFAKFAGELGLELFTVNEVFGTDPDLLAFLPQPCLAAIACVRRMPAKMDEDKARGSLDVQVDYYMDQTSRLDNACGIIALIHSILNNAQCPIKEGSPLALFREAVQGKTSAERAVILDEFTAIHNLYKEAAQEGNQDNLDGTHVHGGEVKTFHFIAYIRNSKGQLVELDGTKQGPWVVAENVSEAELMNAVGKEFQRRVTAEEIDAGAASLMALGPPAGFD